MNMLPINHVYGLPAKLREIDEQLAALRQDSHPPQPVISGDEFDRFRIYLDERIDRMATTLGNLVIWADSVQKIIDNNTGDGK